ncbi:hypothetical protein KFK09_020885 [Dendrobium nobile]|uniref:Uncharacterized protein n=1 Tax=Dendrobium nobile TaxID=94219 RepID=A0A8T3API1_DENNO|nr:hypothetical protein KFK09_020885 [Dendrobium nobile]
MSMLRPELLSPRFYIGSSKQSERTGVAVMSGDLRPGPLTAGVRLYTSREIADRNRERPIELDPAGSAVLVWAGLITLRKII